MRLRPSGNAGPIATRFASFEIYQREQAWTWEHMALTRCRVISGSAKLRQKIERTIHQTLCLPRARAKLVQDVLEMRARIFAEKGSTSLWDLKQVRGGLIDLEFLVQTLQLMHANKHPQCLDPNTAGALRKLAKVGVLDWGDAENLLDGAWLLHILMQILRLCLDQQFDPETAPKGLKKRLARAADSPDFAHLEARLRDQQNFIKQMFDKYVV